MNTTHLVIGVHNHSKDIFVSNDAQYLCVMAAIRRNLSCVKSHCTFAAAFLQRPTPRTIIALGATLNCTDANSYYSCSSSTNCNNILPTIALFTLCLPTQRLATQTNHRPSKTTCVQTIFVSTVSGPHIVAAAAPPSLQLRVQAFCRLFGLLDIHPNGTASLLTRSYLYTTRVHTIPRMTLTSPSNVRLRR